RCEDAAHVQDATNSSMARLISSGFSAIVDVLARRAPGATCRCSTARSWRPCACIRSRWPPCATPSGTSSSPVTLVEKDEPLFIAITVSHFLEQFYSIPTKFDITRFAPPRNEHKQAGAFAPFSLGDHTCLGVSIAEVQIALTMATLFHRLQMELAPSDYQMRMKV